jgi:DNA-binding transcriptional LysR family regulator
VELTPLRSFLVLAREGNMTRAAERLHLTQPAVSAQLARLEGELGHALFDRSSKGMRLTPAGEVFAGHVEDVLRRLEEGQEALDALAGLERGSLAIGGGATATTYLLPPLLGEFHSRHPAIRMFVREQGSQGVVDALAAGELDLGVVTLPVALPKAGGVRLASQPWVQDELRLIVPPDHPLARKRRFRWAQLAGESLVLFEAGTAVRGLIDRQLEWAAAKAS